MRKLPMENYHWLFYSLVLLAIYTTADSDTSPLQDQPETSVVQQEFKAKQASESDNSVFPVTEDNQAVPFPETLQNARDLFSDLEKRYSVLETEVSRLEKDIIDKQAKASNLEELITSSNQQLKEEKQQYEATKTEFSTFKGQLDELKTTYSAYIDKSKQELAQLDKEIQVKKDEKTKLNERIEFLRQNLTELLQQKGVIENENTEVLTKIREDLKGIAEKFNQKIAQQLNEITENHAKINEQEKELDEKRIELINLNKTMPQTQAPDAD